MADARILRRKAREGLDAVFHLLRARRISAVLACTGWLALIVLSSVPSLDVCVATASGMVNGTTNSTTDTSTYACLTSRSYWTLALLLGALLLMANEAAPDLVMLGFTVLLQLSGVISDEEAWAGFCSTSVLSIGALFVVARALEETRAVEKLLLPLLGRPTGHVSALLRLCAPVAVFSAFLNNTPIVAMVLTVCERWAARSNLSIKVLLMPLSFASMLGGMCTLIGTSTNLVLACTNICIHILIFICVYMLYIQHTPSAGSAHRSTYLSALRSRRTPYTLHVHACMHACMHACIQVLNSQIEADLTAPLAPLSMFSMTLVALPAACVGPRPHIGIPT